MLLDVVRDEGAERNDVQALAACVVQRGGGETAPEPTPLARLVDFGIRGGDPAIPAPVSGKADQTLGKPKLVPACLGQVDHLGCRRVARHILELLARAVRTDWRERGRDGQLSRSPQVSKNRFVLLQEPAGIWPSPGSQTGSRRRGLTSEGQEVTRE
jgi:hypothetical protein